MRTFSFIAVLILAFFLINLSSTAAQEDKSKRPSPPAIESKDIGDLKLTIDYSRPSVKGRKIWGGLVPYNKVWRTGANEATTFEVTKDVSIEGHNLPAGKYGLFTIPGEKEWTIIFNKIWDQWGSFEYDKSKDILRITVKPEKANEYTEMMTFTIEESGEVELIWEKLEVEFHVILVEE